MTLVDVLFRYGLPPNERVMSAYGQLSDVYGIRRLQLNEADRTIRVEYDATRLTEAKVEGPTPRGGVRHYGEASAGLEHSTGSKKAERICASPFFAGRLGRALKLNICRRERIKKGHRSRGLWPKTSLPMTLCATSSALWNSIRRANSCVR